MASTSRRILTLGVALVAVSLTGGCIFVDAHFTLAPDGTQHGRIEGGMMQGVGEGEGDFAAQMGESLAEGKWRELGEEMRGQWRVQTLVGEAGPGESLFAADAEPQPKFARSGRLLSTEYRFTLALPDGGETEPAEVIEVPQEQPAPAPPEPGEGEGEVRIEGMDQALEGMMAMMMSSGEAGLRFSVELPGEIVASNGALLGANRAQWSIPLSGPPAELTEMSATSRLLNWPSIGRLGGELTVAGRADLVPALIEGVRRGVVPDPVVADPLTAPLDATMYIQALEIMTALDAAVGRDIATEAMRTLGIGGADVDPARVATVAGRLEGIDLSAEADAAVLQWLLGRLGGG